MTWYYEYNGEQKGPVSDAELEGLIATGVVLPTTLVWRDGLAAWTPLAQVRAGGPTGAFTPTAGTAQCQSCGRYFDAADVIQIGGRNICAGCKPAVLQGLQQGTMVAGFGDPSRTGPPWEERETIGWLPGAWRTVTGVLSQPSETFSNMRVDGGIGEPFLYYLLVGGISNAARIIYLSLAPLLGMSFFPMGRTQQMFFAGGVTIMAVIMQIILGFVFTAIFSFIFAAIFHVCLMLFGGARRPFEATYRVICYGGGSVSMLNLIPLVGMFVALPWTAVAWIIGLARAHETDLWRAVMAILLPFALCCFGFIALITMLVGTMRH